MKVRLIQIQPLIDKEANLQKALTWAKADGIEEVDLVLLPELFTTGYQLENLSHLAEDKEGYAYQQFSLLASKTQTTIIMGSIGFKNSQGKIQNTSLVISKEGTLLGQYSKIHLFSLMDEEKYFEAGETPLLFKLNEELLGGVVICYDLRFPELTRLLALQGAKVLFIPMEWPFPRTEIFRTLLKARAIENQCFVVGCNVVGSGLQEGVRFEGKSAVINPFGDVVAEMKEEEGFLDVELDFSLLEKCRAQIHSFKDRKPELYDCL